MLRAFASSLRRVDFGARAAARVLVIDDWLPEPRIGAGAPRALAILRALAATGASITLLPSMRDPENAADARRLVPGLNVAAGHGGARMGRFLWTEQGSFDLILVSRPHNMIAFRKAATEHRLDAVPSSMTPRRCSRSARCCGAGS